MNQRILLVGILATTLVGAAFAVDQLPMRAVFTWDPSPAATRERLAGGGVLAGAIVAAEKLVEGAARSAEIAPGLERATVVVYGDNGPVLVEVNLETGKARQKETLPPFPGKPVTGEAEVEGDLRYYDHASGADDAPGRNGFVRLQYTTYLLTGEKVEDFRTSNRTKTPLSALAEGLRQGVSTMRPGGQRKLIVPPRLAYADKGAKKIPPGAWLVYEVELLSVVDD